MFINLWYVNHDLTLDMEEGVNKIFVVKQAFIKI